MERVLTSAMLEHFENRCRLLSLEKGLRGEQLEKWVLFDRITSYNVCYTKLLRFPVFTSITVRASVCSITM